MGNNFQNYIKQFPHYSDEAFEAALPYFKHQHLEKGECFIEQGVVCKKIAYIESGLFRTYYLNDGIETTTCFCKENTLATSYKSMITNQASDLSLQAIEACKLLTIQFSDLQELYKKNLFWQQIGRLLAEQAFITAECYTRFLNDQTAEQRYLQILTNESDILQRVPLIYLASYLQITPETLSRIRKKISIS